MRVSVVIPAYNEEAIIGDILRQVIALDVADEIIVVNDGSADDTAAEVQKIVDEYPIVQLQEHPYNIGNGAAVKTGIRASTGDVVVMMDGDGQHPPSALPELLADIDKYEMVVGARSHGTQSAWHRDIANWVFNTYASYIVGYPVADLTSGFRAIRAKTLKSFLYLLPNAYSYPTTITIALFRAGYPVKYHPFASPARVGVSKIRPLRDGFRFLLTVTRLAVFFVPLKIFIPVSMILLIPGVTYVGARLVFFQRFSGFGGLVTTLGVLVFLLGLLAEQIALLRYVNSDR